MVIRTVAHGVLCLSLMAIAPASASEPFPAPEGLKSCPLGDPVLTVETRLATRLGGNFLGCFRSDSIVAADGPAQQVSTPAEYAFALALHDRDYTVDDLHELLSKVKQQWKDFEPVKDRLSDNYIAKLNGILNEQRKAGDTSVKSVRPVLVNIDEGHSRYYTVSSIRTYVVAIGGTNVTATKVNADAVVVRDSRLIRLTVQRTLTDSADVARAQADIDRWARSIA